MSQIQKRNIQGLGTIFLSVFFLMIAIFCFLDKSFTIGQLKVQLGNIFLGFLLLLFTYLVVFKKYKKTRSKVRFIFAFEVLLFVIIIIIGFLLPGLGLFSVEAFSTRYRFIGRFLEFNYCLAFLLLLHSFIELHIKYFQKENSIIFTLYLFMFGVGCFGVARDVFGNARDIILKTIAILSFLQFFYLAFVGIKKKISNNNAKTSSKGE
ncbi:hypothetical protein [Candidatus Phytoplasma solani]|uniref:hypothetical protein n=1 Tax=Candidatus Phytoplasma solani TaxID=69896 RepID=UPI0003B7D7BA|nr:hypothetical protein [Candidatus Phytoplasma solani]CCP88448.1 conserved hypothetical protein [Candidatus Phytoplasma solani]